MGGRGMGEEGGGSRNPTYERLELSELRYGCEDGRLWGGDGFTYWTRRRDGMGWDGIRAEEKHSENDLNYDTRMMIGKPSSKKPCFRPPPPGKTFPIPSV